MASAEQLKALLKSHIEGDEVRFFSIAMQVAAHEAKLGHGKLAEELRDMIDSAKSHSQKAGSAGNLVPLNKPRGELAGLLSVSYPKTRLADMILDESVSEKLKRTIKEQRLFAKLQEHGLSPRRKLLLVGQPGTGKTMTASVLAAELGIPLFLVRLDSLSRNSWAKPPPSYVRFLMPSAMCVESTFSTSSMLLARKEEWQTM